MLERVKTIVMNGVMLLAVVVISLPTISFAATSPVVTVLSPIQDGLSAPTKLAIDASGNIYVSDQRANGVVKYNTYGVKQGVVPVSSKVTAVALAQDGTLLVADGDVLVRYNTATGEELARFGQGLFKSVGGIAVDPMTGYVYASDASARQVLVFTSSGSFVKAFGAPLLVSPAGVAFEKVSRQVIVSDAMGNVLQFFDADGVFVKSMGTLIPGTATTFYAGTIAPMQFFTPVAVALEYSKDTVPVLNRMYVVTSFQGNLQVVDAATSTALLVAGTAKNFIGSPGALNGQLMNPSDAIFDSVNNRLLVVNGYGNITIYGIDGGKNPVDVTPPVFTVNPLPAEVAVDALVISGVVEAGSSIQIVSAEGAAVGAVSYSGSSWSAMVTGLVAGNNSFTVTAKDAVGNVAAPQVANVTYLIPPPAVSVDVLPAVSNVSFITVSGSVDNGSSVTVTNSATSQVIAAQVIGASWSCAVQLSEGVNNFIVTAQKPASAKALVPVAITLDTLPPVLSVSAVADGSYTSTQVQNVAGVVSDASGIASVVVNGVPVQLVAGNFSIPVTLATGINSINVAAHDVAGNVSINSRTVNFDAVAPVVTVTSPMDNSFTNNPLTHVTGEVDKAAVVTVNGQSALVAANNVWSIDLQLVNGVKTLDIAATDLYGNTSVVKRTIALDLSSPLLSIKTPAQDIATNVAHLNVAGIVSDAVATSVSWQFDGSSGVAEVNAGSYVFAVNFTREGTFPITVTAVDQAGNVTTAIRNVIYDVTPPLLTVDKKRNTSVKKLSGTVESGAVVRVADAKKSFDVVAVVDASGNWNLVLPKPAGAYTKLFITATDAANNSTTKTLKSAGNDHDDDHDDDRDHGRRN